MLKGEKTEQLMKKKEILTKKLCRKRRSTQIAYAEMMKILPAQHMRKKEDPIRAADAEKEYFIRSADAAKSKDLTRAVDAEKVKIQSD